MHYNDHDCFVFLSGILSTMPVITPDWTGNGLIIVSRKHSCSHKLENHRVIINQNDMARIISTGYLDMPIFIHGELQLGEIPKLLHTRWNLLIFQIPIIRHR